MQGPHPSLRFSPPYLRRAKAVATHARSMAWLARPRSRSADGLRILLYHRVSDDRDPLAVPVGRFRRQMERLAAEGYVAVDLLQAWRRLAAGSSCERVVALTFDDGYRDVAVNALPVIERFGFSATAFVVTGAVDATTRFSWYRRQPDLLAWGDIAALDASSPLCFEAHSDTHPNLLALAEEDARAEMLRSKEALEERLARPVRAFAYPLGAFGPRERRLAAEAGFEVAVGSDPGVNDADSDPLALCRIAVDPADRLFDFRAKVEGGHDTALPLRSSYRRRRYGIGAAGPPGPASAGSRPRRTATEP